jgi:hypothetical protein
MRRPALVFAAAWLVFAAMFVPREASASEWEPDVQPWMQLLVRGNLEEKVEGLRVEVDVQARRLNAPLYYPDPSVTNVAVQSPNTLLIARPYVGYQFKENMGAWVGYVYQPDLFDDPEMRKSRNIHEHRIFTQFTVANAHGPRLLLTTRARMEHRVRTHGPGSPDNDGGLSNWAHRFRIFERVALAFKPDLPWFALISSETFFHLNETKYPSKPGIDQQRTFVGLGYRFGMGDRVELGYLNQLVRRYTDPHQLNHVVMTSIVISLRSK